MFFVKILYFSGEEFRSLHDQYTLSPFCFLASQNFRQGLRILSDCQIQQNPETCSEFWYLCAGEDSNLCRNTPGGLQPPAFDHSATDAFKI